ncbi:MAG: beta-galactosidase trimerization domain-containing protein, partial [Oliverpabstia sp.]
MHVRGAKALSLYEKDFYADTPVITENSYGKGKAYYIGTRPEADFLKIFLREKMDEAGVKNILETVPGVEVTERVKKKRSFWFVMNHEEEERSMVLTENRRDLLTGKSYKKNEKIVLPPKEVMILEGETTNEEMENGGKNSTGQDSGDKAAL